MVNSYDKVKPISKLTNLQNYVYYISRLSSHAVSFLKVKKHSPTKGNGSDTIQTISANPAFASITGGLTGAACGGRLVFEAYALVQNANISPDSGFIYDTNTKQWISSALTTARFDAAAAGNSDAVLGDLVLFAGGQTADSQPSGVIDIYNTTTGKWYQSKLAAPATEITAASTGATAIFGYISQTGTIAQIFQQAQ